MLGSTQLRHGKFGSASSHASSGQIIGAQGRIEVTPTCRTCDERRPRSSCISGGKAGWCKGCLHQHAQRGRQAEIAFQPTDIGEAELVAQLLQAGDSVAQSCEPSQRVGMVGIPLAPDARCLGDIPFGVQHPDPSWHQVSGADSACHQSHRRSSTTRLPCRHQPCWSCADHQEVVHQLSSPSH